MQSKFTLVIFALVFALGALSLPNAALADLPTGERQLGQSVIEPVYDDLNGTLAYVLTPIHAPEHSHAVAPFYVIVYPTAVAGVIGTVNCQHQPMDNCPDHGPGIAGLARATIPGVYGAGVWGHDHTLSVPPAPPPVGGDFNIAWVPTVVLFNDLSFASQHITTLSQLNAAIAAHEVTVIPLPADTFHCSVVPAATYNRGTPVPPAPPLP